ncbi:MAG: DMT family transporter [Bacteroidetes bacterium]|nr:DMT family transporter [Bacteroidota bacterium]
MSATGFLFAFAATACWAIAAFPLTTASRLIPVSSMNHVRLLLGTVLITIAAWITDSENFLQIFSFHSLYAWIWLGLSGIMALVVGDFFSFRSYAILSPQKGSILTTLSPTSALLFGILLVDEHINWVGIAGMIITIAGVMSISLGRSQRNAIPDHGHGSITKGIVYGILAALCHGGALALSKKGFLVQAAAGHPVGWSGATFIRIASACVLVYAITLVRGQFKEVWSHLGDSKEGIRNTITGSIFNPGLSVALSMITILYINVAVAQTIFAMVPLFALVIAFFIYREKVTLRSLLGICISLIGVALLIWRNRLG